MGIPLLIYIILLGIFCLLLFIYIGMVSFIDFLLVFFAIEMLFYLFLYISIWYHIMFLIMILEFFILKNYLLSIIVFNLWKRRIYFIYVFITLRVAEASIGLSLLTLLIRSHGSDYLGVEGL